MKIFSINQQKDLAIPSPSVKAIARSVLDQEEVSCDEISIHFVSEKKISELHSQYFDDPTPTDCITFPIDSAAESGYRILGDVFVCPKTAIHYAWLHDLDPYAETTLYIVHGILHLIGYDDIHKKDKMEMRKAEKRHMQFLQKRKLILPSSSAKKYG